MTYSRAIVAIDLTEDSAQVLETARKVSDRDGTELYIISVVKPLAQVYGGIDGSIAPQSARFEQEIEEQASQRLAEFASQCGVSNTHTRVLRGSPATEIRDFAEEVGADLVITGSHGRHGIRLLMGSTATGVLHGIKCDLLTVRLQEAA